MASAVGGSALLLSSLLTKSQLELVLMGIQTDHEALIFKLENIIEYRNKNEEKDKIIYCYDNVICPIGLKCGCCSTCEKSKDCKDKCTERK